MMLNGYVKNYPNPNPEKYNEMSRVNNANDPQFPQNDP